MPALSRIGVALWYERTGGGTARPMVLVHGWCCDHTYVSPQLQHFGAQGHAVAAPDLRGHGRSDAPHEPYTMQVLADDVAWLCAQLRLAKPM